MNLHILSNVALVISIFYSQYCNLAEELGQQKLATQCIYRELHEADEANLLDEEGNFLSIKFFTGKF